MKNYAEEDLRRRMYGGREEPNWTAVVLLLIAVGLALYKGGLV